MSLSQLQNHLECPICYEQFDRIIQCKKGHSVCDTCSRDLERCPICREVYLGTRNFALEEVIHKLKELKTTAKSVPPPKPQPTVFHSGLVTKVPPPPPPPTPPAVAHHQAPVQSAGLFLCRVNNCSVRLPICRLYNHLRSNHPASIREYNFSFHGPDPVFRLNLRFPTNTNRAVEYVCIGGNLFAVVFCAHNVVLKTRQLFCWVQAARGNHDAREHSFALSVTMNNRCRAEYSDYVHGDQSDEAYIQFKKTCLHMYAPSYVKKVTFELDIFRTVRSRGAPRCVTTVWNDI